VAALMGHHLWVEGQEAGKAGASTLCQGCPALKGVVRQLSGTGKVKRLAESNSLRVQQQHCTSAFALPTC